MQTGIEPDRYVGRTRGNQEWFVCCFEFHTTVGEVVQSQAFNEEGLSQIQKNAQRKKRKPKDRN